MAPRKVSLEVIEERVGAIASRMDDMVVVVQAANMKLDKVIALEVKQTELHADVRASMDRLNKVADDINGLGARVSIVENVVGKIDHTRRSDLVVLTDLSKRMPVVETTLETHKRNFRIIAGFITGTFLTGLGIVGWMANRLYDGILEAVARTPGVGH